MDKRPFVVPSFEELDKLTFELAKKILKKKRSYDRMVVLAKGGWTMARNMVDYLNLNIASSIQFISYQGTQKQSKPVLVQPLSREGEILGERVLVFDDVSDSGETLIEAKKYLENLGAKVETAVLYLKPHSKIEPDFYSTITSCWVVFPHEKREFIEEMTKAWRKNGLTRNQIKAKLISLGLPTRQVDYFLPKE